MVQTVAIGYSDAQYRILSRIVKYDYFCQLAWPLSEYFESFGLLRIAITLRKLIAKRT